MRINTTPEAKFWAHLPSRPIDPDACWEWTPNTGDHCRFYLENYHRTGAHRYSWELHYGPIPEGIDVCHTCDNPPCCRPEHLFLGTHAVNMRDMSAKGRGAFGDTNWLRRHPELRRGELNPVARLRELDVLAIRRRHAESGDSFSVIASDYGVSTSTIAKIVERLRWAHVS